MKYITVLFLFISIVVQAQNRKDQTLMLHYDFSKTTDDGVVKDRSGNSYEGTLKNHAFTDSYGDRTIVNLGLSNGYIDLGQRVGELIASLKDFSIGTYVCVPEYVDLMTHGNFLWSFSNSTDVSRDRSGASFFSMRNLRYAITKTDYKAESAIEVATPLEKGKWKHVVYTQSDNNASIYVDGTMVKTGTVESSPANAVGKTIHNFIGRSAYIGDAYLRALISDFRIYRKTLSQEEVTKLAADLPVLNELYTEYSKKPLKLQSSGNPLFSHKYTADPGALVHNGTFYIYAGQDIGNGNGYNMPNWTVFSSQDLSTWYEHSIPLATNNFKWATGNNSWASQVIERDGKFFWYVSTEHATIQGKAIGVAVADSPTGPFRDARGTALVTNNMTTQQTGISWDDIDPTVWIDDDGQAYLFWGNTQCYYAKLNKNMIDLEGSINAVTLPAFTEAPWLHKRGEWYYLSYATGFPERIAYAMSKSIKGPWEYKGVINGLAGNSNTNHHSIVEFKGKWYFVYHNGGVQGRGGSFLRSVCMDYLYYNEDGTIKRVIMTDEGVAKVDQQ